MNIKIFGFRLPINFYVKIKAMDIEKLVQLDMKLMEDNSQHDDNGCDLEFYLSALER